MGPGCIPVWLRAALPVKWTTESAPARVIARLDE